MTYTVDEKELSRRIIAFRKLLLSAVVASLLALLLIPIENRPWLILIIILLAVFLIILLIITQRSFKSLRLIRVQTEAEYLVREYNGKVQKIAYTEISRLKTVMSTRKLLREILIYDKEGKVTIINGIVNLEGLYSELIAKSKKDIAIIQAKELLDYDHPLFYILFGSALGFSLVYLTNLLTNLSGEQLKFLFIILTANNFILGTYFGMYKPIEKRYGHKTLSMDYLFAAFLFLTGCGLAGVCSLF